MTQRASVRTVPVFEGGLAAARFPGVDYADAYAVGVPPDVSARTLAEAVFASGPPWVAGLMALRNTIVRPFGLIATQSALERAAAANGSGARIGIFPALAETAEEVLLGLDDRHPTLAKVLASWKVMGWRERMKRAPKAGDLIIPTINGTHRDVRKALED